MTAMARALFAAIALIGASACGGDQTPPTVTSSPPSPPNYAGRIFAADEAIHSADISAIDPGELTEAEIRRALGAGALCRFRYSRAGPPVLAFRPPAAQTAGRWGLVKLNGRLVALGASADDDRSAQLTADGIHISVTPIEPGAESADANMIFRLQEGLLVGYRGSYSCGDQEA